MSDFKVLRNDIYAFPLICKKTLKDKWVTFQT